MIVFTQTNSNDKDFRQLVVAMDQELKVRDGDDHLFYSQLNKTDMIRHVIVAYENNETVGCGAIRSYSDDTKEVKRMFVQLNRLGHGIASLLLKELECWCKELSYKKCILETGKNQPEAIRLYKKNDYKMITNFGKYFASNSIFFERELV